MSRTFFNFLIPQRLKFTPGHKFNFRNGQLDIRLIFLDISLLSKNEFWLKSVSNCFLQQHLSVIQYTSYYELASQKIFITIDLKTVKLRREVFGKLSEKKM